MKMKGIPQEKMEEIIDYFFHNENNTAGAIAKKFGIKLWQADKIVGKIVVTKPCTHSNTELRFTGEYDFYLEKQALFCMDCNKKIE